MLARLAHTFSPQRLPRMARPSYRRELAAAVALPAALGLVEGGVAGVLGRKVFHIGDVALATISAAPMFANLTSFAWARLTRGRRKPPAIAAVISTLIVAVAAIGALPVSEAGGWGLTGLVVTTRCLMAGVVTLRSVVWRQNYPEHLRGRITARFASLRSVVLLTVAIVGALLLDWRPHAFRWLYPVGAMIALAAALAYRRLRLRGERALLGEETRPAARHKHEPPPAIDERQQRAVTADAGWVALLKRDPLFRRYMFWQFVAGTANQMCEPVLIAIVAARTEGIAGGFLASVALTQVLPVLLMLLTVGRWARLLDRVHVARFRARQAWLWIAAQLLMFAGAVWAPSLGGLAAGLAVLALGRVALGIARGGGVLAWQLGHNDFARRELVAMYMGVHVTLTGVRGVIAPFLGMGLYAGWTGFTLGPVTVPGLPGIAGWTFAVAAAGSTTALLGFRNLAHHVAPR